MTALARRRVTLVASFVFSQLVLLLVLRMPAVPGEGSWLQAFRSHFSYDQLSYAGIVSTAAAGVGGLPEPFTETGQSFYPSLWYRGLGWLASLTGASVPAVWTVGGFAILATCVALVGWVAYRISGLPWGPALVGPALAVGTLSVVAHDNWYTPLASHAVLWGPFGSLYVLNAETAGAACVVSALVLVLRSVAAPVRPAARIALLTIAALLLGVTANIQTYTFFVGAGIAFSWLGAYGLMRSRSRPLVLVSAALVVTTFLLGSRIAGVVGALPVFGLFIACTLPGVLWVLVRQFRVLTVPAVVFVLAAVPQALIVANGIISNDPFLAYRQDTSADLGVPVWLAFLATLPVIAAWAFSLVVARNARHPQLSAALAGMAFSGIMLTFNDAWGFSQEPYRMWIASLTVSLLLLAPISAWSIARVRALEPGVRPRLVPITAGLAVILLGLSILDFGAFRSYVSQSGVVSFDSARHVALGAITEEVDGLLTSGPCLDPQEVKIATRKPVAFYNLGLAWPEDKAGIDGVVDSWRAGTYSPDALRAARVRYLVTDSSCATQWPVDGTMGVIAVRSLDYSDAAGAGTLTLWRFA